MPRGNAGGIVQIGNGPGHACSTGACPRGKGKTVDRSLHQGMAFGIQRAMLVEQRAGKFRIAAWPIAAVARPLGCPSLEHAFCASGRTKRRCLYRENPHRARQALPHVRQCGPAWGRKGVTDSAPAVPRGKCTGAWDRRNSRRGRDSWPPPACRPRESSHCARRAQWPPRRLPEAGARLQGLSCEIPAVRPETTPPGGQDSPRLVADSPRRPPAPHRIWWCGARKGRTRISPASSGGSLPDTL